jgi:hypothetical protein
VDGNATVKIELLVPVNKLNGFTLLVRTFVPNNLTSAEFIGLFELGP